MNQDIQVMLKKPGRYAVSDAGFKEHGRYAMVEVEENGTVHQLNPKKERDGVLDPNRWLPEVQVYLVDEAERFFVRLIEAVA